MTANERHDEIIRILVSRRHEIITNLARELAVCERTIRRDILTLMAKYPLETHQGHDGGVTIADWYHAPRPLLNLEQQRVLTELVSVGNARQAHVLRELLSLYGSMKPNEIGGTR